MSDSLPIRFALPKGRMEEGVRRLLADAGVHLRAGSRSYRPTLNLPDFEVKILKPQNIVEMLQFGSRDFGFAGADWVDELGGGLVELFNTELDPVRLVAAAPKELVAKGWPTTRQLVVASEYEKIARRWIERSGVNARFVRSFGATEVFPPEDADVIVDNTATGATLTANGLEIVDTLMQSTTRLYAHPASLDIPHKREAMERLVLLLKSVLSARERVMVEVNVDKERLESVCSALPCMREPTISTLHGDAGYAVKAAVPKRDLPSVIPEIKARGGTDIVVTAIAQIVP